MYTAFYDIDHNHITNVTIAKANIIKKVYEFNTAEFERYSDCDVSDTAYAIYNNNVGETIYSGYIKEITHLASGHITFRFDDFRKLLDKDVLLDFSQSIPNHALYNIFFKVMDAAAGSGDYMNTIITIRAYFPNDYTDTTHIADYTHDYLIVNAWDFLKVYLAYYGYYIQATFNRPYARIEFTFIKRNIVKEIKLKDFIFEKQTTSIKTNKSLATITYPNNLISGENEWEDSDEAYWGGPEPVNRSSEVTLPDANGFEVGHAMQLFIGSTYSFMAQNATADDYVEGSPDSINLEIEPATDTCPSLPPSTSEILSNLTFSAEEAFNSGQKVVRAKYQIYGDPMPLPCDPVRYVWVTGARNSNYDYYKVIGTKVYAPRPNIVEKVYILGKDNEIYAGYPDSDVRIYPVKTKIFEDDYLSKAQFKAVFELVNSRYNETIILDNSISPIDLRELGLYTFIDIYDKNGNVRQLPVTEIREKNDSYKIKLGFKKQKFTELVKV